MLERTFELEKRATTVRTELLAGRHGDISIAVAVLAVLLVLKIALL